MTTTLAILYERGPNWIGGQRSGGQPLREHLDNLFALHKNCRVSVNRPYADETDCMVILTADDAVEVERLIVSDPAVVAGTLKAKVKAWYCVA